MKEVLHPALLVVTMSLGTAALRFLPFFLFRKKTPSYISYLGKVLPSAIIGMLVVFCLKDTDLTHTPHGLPELIALIIVVVLQVWKRNSLLSILGGTIVYMLLIQLVFNGL